MFYKLKMTDHIVNVKELKKKKKRKESGPKKPQKQMEPFYIWILYGAGAGIIFVLLAFVNIQFLYIAPLGPILGAVGWLIKKILYRFNFGESSYFK